MGWTHNPTRRLLTHTPARPNVSLAPLSPNPTGQGFLSPKSMHALLYSNCCDAGNPCRVVPTAPPRCSPLARPCHYPSLPCGSPTPCRATMPAASRAHVGRLMPAHLAWSVDKQRPDKLLPNHRPLQGSRPFSPTSAHPSATSTHVH
jgi:hypothetical protein